MRRLIFILLSILIVENTEGQNSRAFTLEEAIEYALNNNIEIKDAQISVEDADQRVIETRAMGIPQVNFSTDFKHFLKLPITILPEQFGLNPITGEPNPDFNNEVAFGVKNTFNMGLEFTSLLFDGSYFTGLEAARVYTNQVRLQFESEKAEVRNTVKDAYLPALIIEENQKILDKNISNLEKLLFETQELYKAGFVEQLDVDRLELSLANIKAEKENLESQKELVINYLKYQMGYPMEEDLSVSDDLKTLLTIPTQKDLDGDIDYTQRAEYTVVQSAVNLNELNVKRYKDGYLPQLIAFGSYGVTWQGDNFKDGAWTDNSVVGLQLNVPIFDGFNKKAKVQRANLQLEMVKNRKIRLERAIELQVQNARTSYKNALKRVEDRQKNLDLAQRIYDTSQIKYKEGVGSSLEITQAEQGLFQAQSNLINAKYDLLVAQINLDTALGK